MPLIKEKVVVIIPTYNESLVISDTITQVLEMTQPDSCFDLHLLIFDSASMDDTTEKVIALQSTYPNLHLQRELKKSGLGSAYLQAMRYALDSLQADIVFEFDADLSHQPKYILPMLHLIHDGDVVIGSRYVKGGSIPRNWGWHRKLFSVLGNWVARVILTPKYKDFTSGFRATRRKILNKVLPTSFLSNHYAYKLQLLWLLHKNNAKIYEYPIAFVDREQGESKLPKNSIIDSLRVVFTLRYQELRRYFKMCMVGLIGTAVQFAVYNILREYLSPFNASQIAVLAAVINNFILNNKYTFKSDFALSRMDKTKRLAGFTLYSLMMIAVQSYWLHLGVSYFGQGALKENIIVALGIGIGSLLNYFTYSRHIWPESLQISEPEQPGYNTAKAKPLDGNCEE